VKYELGGGSTAKPEASKADSGAVSLREGQPAPSPPTREHCNFSQRAWLLKGFLAF